MDKTYIRFIVIIFMKVINDQKMFAHGVSRGLNNY